MKIVKSAQHYTDAALDEIEILKKAAEVTLLFNNTLPHKEHQYSLLFCREMTMRRYQSFIFMIISLTGGQMELVS